MNVTFYIMLYALLCALVAVMAALRGFVRGRFGFVLFLVVLVLTPLPFLLGLLLLGAPQEKSPEKNPEKSPEKKAETPP